MYIVPLVIEFPVRVLYSVRVHVCASLQCLSQREYLIKMKISVSATKHDVRKPITVLDSACIFVSCYMYNVYECLVQHMIHVICLYFQTTTSNVRLK